VVEHERILWCHEPMRRCLASTLLFVLLMGCRSSDQIPDPESFEPVGAAPQTDHRTIVFHNESVEMAEVEIYVPGKPIADCEAEAPHRLLCPSDYRSLLNKRVYPRTKVTARYPPALPLSCAQVWIRAHSKAMPPDVFREAIFLLPQGVDKQLVLELGAGKAARLDQRDLKGRYRFPAPVRYCDPERPEQTAAPKETTRPQGQVDQVVATLGDQVKACCKDAACRGKRQFSVRLRRDGTVLRSTVAKGYGGATDKEKALTACLGQALSRARFAGFTPAQTTAEIVFKLPPGR
jgi:hypothetical protein